MTSMGSWCNEMQKFAKGLASLSNIIYDCTLRRVGKTILQSFFKRLLLFWDSRNTGTFNSPENFITQVVEGDPNRYLCKGPKVSSGSQTCSRIMHAQDFLKHNIRRHQVPFPISDRAPRSQLMILEGLGIKNATDGNMETRLPYAWVTRTDQIEEIKKTHRNEEDRASTIRTLLGLYHFQEDEHLVEIIYPIDFMDTQTLHAPTFLEGCPSLIYRSKQTTDGWGRAVNLETLEDGLPEAVHLSVKFTDDFSIKYLGRLSPMKAPLDWNAFILKMPKPWQPSMVSELEKYV